MASAKTKYPYNARNEKLRQSLLKKSKQKGSGVKRR